MAAENAEDFPTYNFPERLCPHRASRSIFVNYGSIACLNASEEDDRSKEHCYSITCQKHPFSSEDPRLCSSAPSLPLLPPQPVDQMEPCLGEIKELRNRLKVWIKKIKIIKRDAKKNYFREGVFEAYDNLRKMQRNGSLHRNPEDVDLTVKDWQSIVQDTRFDLLHLAKESLGILGEDMHVPLVNNRYTDGCISFLGAPPGGSSSILGYLAYPSGPAMDQLWFSPTEKLNQDRLKVHNNQSCCVNQNGRIYSVDTVQTQGEDYCLSRTADTCKLYKVTTNSINTNCQLDEIHCYSSDAFSVTSAKISPYIEGECVLASNEDEGASLQLWQPGHCPHAVVEHVTPRFTVPYKWQQCYFASHPRQMVLADATGLALYDARVPGRCRPSELFTLPHTALNKIERVCVAHPVNQWHHLVATDYSVLMMDQRFPNHCVLHLPHTLLSPPAYLTTVIPGVRAGADDLVLVGTQDKPEVHCYPLSPPSGHHPLSASAPPWRISKPEDIFNFALNHGKGWNRDVCRSFLKAPLIGIAAASHEDSHGVSFIQMTSHGNLFSQDYRITTDIHADKTCASGPGIKHVVLDDDIISICSNWLHEALDKVVDPEQQWNTEDTSDRFTALAHSTYAHVMCSLCMELADSNAPSESDTISPTTSGDKCCACHQRLEDTANFVESVKKGEVAPSISEVMPVLPNILQEIDIDATSFTEPYSQLLLKLWHEDSDISQLLKLRDVNVKADHQARMERWLKEQNPDTLNDSLEESEEEDYADTFSSTDKVTGVEAASASNHSPARDIWESQRHKYPSDHSLSTTQSPRSRHSSAASISSVHKHSNNSILNSSTHSSIGFLATPPRILQSSTPFHLGAGDMRRKLNDSSIQPPAFSSSILFKTPEVMPSRFSQSASRDFDTVKSSPKKKRKTFTLGF